MAMPSHRSSIVKISPKEAKRILDGFRTLQLETRQLPSFNNAEDFAYQIEKVSLLKEEDVTYSTNTCV